jgi:hypothetical protein
VGSFFALKSLNPKEKSRRLIVNTNIDSKRWQPKFCMRASRFLDPQIFDKSNILSLENYPKSFRRIYLEMAVHCKIILKKPEKAQFFLW